MNACYSGLDCLTPRLHCRTLEQVGCGPLELCMNLVKGYKESYELLLGFRV